MRSSLSCKNKHAFPEISPVPRRVGGTSLRRLHKLRRAAAAQAVQPKETKVERASQLRQVPRGEYAENSERKDFIMSEIDALGL